MILSTAGVLIDQADLVKNFPKAFNSSGVADAPWVVLPELEKDASLKIDVHEFLAGNWAEVDALPPLAANEHVLLFMSDTSDPDPRKHKHHTVILDKPVPAATTVICPSQPDKAIPADRATYPLVAAWKVRLK